MSRVAARTRVSSSGNKAISGTELLMLFLRKAGSHDPDGELERFGCTVLGTSYSSRFRYELCPKLCQFFDSTK